MNEAILELIHKLNQRPFRKLPGSRAELYQNLDRPALQPLPLQPFVFAEWKKTRVNLDYHVEVDEHYYSTPYQLVGKEVEVRSTRGTVEIIYQGKRIASHVRSSQPHVPSTLPEHRPKSHQQYLQWTPSRMIDWAGKRGSLRRASGGVHHCRQAAPGDGLSFGSGRDPVKPEVWRRAARSGLHAGRAF